MKKIVCLVLAIVLCLSIAAPAMATKEIFIPSMGMVASDVTVNGDAVAGGVVVTAVPAAKDGTASISQEDKDLLLKTYGELSDGTVEVPFNQKYVFFDMFYLSFADDVAAEFAEELAKDGVTITLTLDPENKENTELIAFVLVDDKWVPALKTQNNSDGTVTVTLEDLGPIVFIVPEGETEDEPETTEPGETEDTTVTNIPTFVPSIGYKPGPEIVDVETNIVLGNGEAYGNDKIDDCVIVTSIDQAKNKATDIHQDDRDLLLELYEKLSSGSMTLPVEKDYVIRDLVDINFLLQKCREKEEHQEKIANLKENGVIVTITFRMGVTPGTKLAAMKYDDETGKWEQVPELTVNSDGTVTLVLEEMAPVAFLTDGNAQGVTPWTGDMMGNSIGIWIAVMVICAGGIVALVVLRKKQK